VGVTKAEKQKCQFAVVENNMEGGDKCLNLLTLVVSFISGIKESDKKGRYDRGEDKYF
jgi:hypothetical protein